MPTSLLPRLPLLAMLTLGAALAACTDPPGDERTVGQRLDGAVAEAKQTAQATQREAQQVVAQAESSATQAAAATSQAAADLAITARAR